MLWDSFRYSFRSLRRNPGFAVAAILALGIGIGSNTAMFSVIDGILLKPLPFAEPERIVQVREKLVKRSGDPIPLAAGNFYDYRDQAKTADVVAYRNSPFSLISPSADPERYIGVQVSEGWFRLFGVKLERGRDFIADDYRPGQDQAVILSYGLWKDRFAGDDAIVGRQINLNGQTRVVVGVAGAAFEYPAKAKIWAPLVLDGFDKTRRDLHSLVGLGRLKPGVGIESTRTEFTTLLGGMAERFPQFNADIQSHVTPLMEDITGPIRPALLALLGAVGFVLAIACANVANLLLARGAARQQEMAVRVSLGASRWNLVSQMLVESFVLAACGGALGVGLAYLGLQAFQRFAPKTLPRVDQVGVDGRVLLFALAAVVMTAVLFGVLPALRLSQLDPHGSLKDRAKGSAGKSGFRNALVVAQVAAALVLMTGAGLLIRSLYELASVDLGFEPKHVITMRVTPLPSKYASSVEKQIQFGRDVVTRLQQTPGMEAAGLSTDLPLQGNARYIMRVEGAPMPTVATAPLADFFTVTPGYFDAMRIALKGGRVFSDSDKMGAPLAVVVNEQFVKTHFPNQDPVGQRMEVGFSQPPNWRVIVGVVSDVKNLGVDKPSRSQVYGAYYQGPGLLPGAPSFSVIGRARGEASEMAQVMRREILQVDHSQPVWNIQTMEETVNLSLGRERFTLMLMAIFAGVAFLLALIGLVGLMTYTVSQRTREIGIRMAVGAKPLDVLLMVEKQGLVLVAIGIVLGTIVSLALAQTLATLLYATSATDPMVFAGVAAVFLFTALIAGWLPARRAARIDPAITLRAD